MYKFFVVCAAVGVMLLSVIYFRGQPMRGRKMPAGPSPAQSAELQSLSIWQRVDDLISVRPVSDPRAKLDLRFKVPTFAPVTLSVHDRDGVVIRRLIRKNLTSGIYQIHWFGETDLGPAPAPGIYIAVLQIDGFRHQKKIVLIE